MEEKINDLRWQTMTKWVFVILCTCCFFIARGELTAQANARVSFDEYPNAVIYTPVRSDREGSVKDLSMQRQEFEMSSCSCIHKEYQPKKEASQDREGLAWGTISKVLPK